VTTHTVPRISVVELKDKLDAGTSVLIVDVPARRALTPGGFAGRSPGRSRTRQRTGRTCRVTRPSSCSEPDRAKARLPVWQPC
jgi:hypothetical protein